MKPRIWSLAPAALACVAICAVAAAQEKQPVEPEQPAQTRPAQEHSPAGKPRLELSVREWNFGEVWQGTPLKFELVVKNLGAAPLEFLAVQSSCGCTVPTKPKSPLAPGASDTVKISFDSVIRRDRQNQTVTFVTNDPIQPKMPFKVSGNVKPVYDIKSSLGGNLINSISFGKLYQDSRESRTIDIFNRYSEKMLLKLKEEQDFGAYAIELKEVERGQHYQVTATPRTPLEVGAARGSVVLLTGFKHLPEIRVLIFGSVQPPISIVPSRLMLPKQSVMSMQRTLEVFYAPGRPIKVLSAKATHASIKVEVRETKLAEGKLDQYRQVIIVELPPGDQVPEGLEPVIEILTDAQDPLYQKVVVPIRILAPRSGKGPSPGKVSIQRSAISAQPKVEQIATECHK
ncbi:MAG: DUF1573 domain-containing protein [Phycisphaerae bacterium]|nr:DUF1573 domain-containing protein [Phycisphaerae bacterium]